MLDKRKIKEKSHIIDLIKGVGGRKSNYALLIGAGASASSGVKTASQMIAEWRQQLFRRSKSNEKFEDWLRGQSWYGSEEEYSILFEELYDQQSQRRDYIEECVKDAKPSWGYICLSNIIAHGYFNVVFTPNFDDLLNEACFLYSDLKPIVCAHDSAVAGIRITPIRPKIIKLHGDFLYDNIKNTRGETKSLQKNMRDKFKEFSKEYGLIIIGYGGNDKSIMNIINTLLKSQGYFPYGVYWCLRDLNNISRKLNRLLQEKKIYLIKITDFDEFMAELHEGLSLPLPDAVGKPYEATTKRLDRFISSRGKVKHPIIKKDIAEVEKQVKRFEQVISGKVTKEEFDRLVPYRFLGDRAYGRSNYGDALAYYKKALRQNSDDLDIMWNIIDSYNWLGDFKNALKMSDEMIKCKRTYWGSYYQKGNSLFYLNRINDSIESYSKALRIPPRSINAKNDILAARSNAFLINGDWRRALRDAEMVVMRDPKHYAALINKCIALKKLGKLKDANSILQKALPEIDDVYNLAAAYAILEDKPSMLEKLKEAIEKDSGNKIDARFDPDFRDYRDDPDFKKLIYD